MKYKLLVVFIMGMLSSFIGGSAGMIAASPYTQDRTERVFIYGTLLNPVTRTIACWCVTDTYPFTLTGYARTIRNIIPSPNGQVPGSIIAVSKRELARLDAYEGVPEKYVRTLIKINRRDVWVYLKNE